MDKNKKTVQEEVITKGHIVKVSKDFNRKLGIIKENRSAEDASTTKPILINEFAEKGVAVQELLDSKEYSDKEILAKIRKTFADE